MRGWEPDRKRWTRMYKGVRFRRTPKQLGLPPDQWTEEGSYPAWISWLRRAVSHWELTGKAFSIDDCQQEVARLFNEFQQSGYPNFEQYMLLYALDCGKPNTLAEHVKSIEIAERVIADAWCKWIAEN